MVDTKVSFEDHLKEPEYHHSLRNMALNTILPNNVNITFPFFVIVIIIFVICFSDSMKPQS